MQYTAIGHGRRQFMISNDQMGTIGQLDYETWSINKASVTIADHHAYDFAPAGFWQTTIQITKYDQPYASIETNWRGGLIISFENGNSFILKKKGIFSSAYVVVDNEEHEVANVHPDFKWSSFSFDYEIEVADHFLNNETLVSMPFLITYGVRYLTMRHAAAV